MESPSLSRAALRRSIPQPRALRLSPRRRRRPCSWAGNRALRERKRPRPTLCPSRHHLGRPSRRTSAVRCLLPLPRPFLLPPNLSGLLLVHSRPRRLLEPTARRSTIAPFSFPTYTPAALLEHAAMNSR